jgi:hypothetical protein
MNALEIFRIGKRFSPYSPETIRQEAKDLVNQKHYKSYRLINADFDVAENAGCTCVYKYETPKHLLNEVY